MRSNSWLVSGSAFLVVAALHGAAFAQKTPDYRDTNRYTTDLNHKGWTDDKDPLGPKGRTWQIYWVPVKAACPECQILADAYQDLADELMHVRHALHTLRTREQALQDWVKAKAAESKGEDAARLTAVIVDTAPDVHNAKTQLLRDEQLLMAKLKRLGKELSDCNLRCPEGTVVDSLQDVRAVPRTSDPYNPPFPDTKPDDLKESTLPFPWAGPYKEVCFRCAKLAARLNELRALTLEAQFDIEWRKRDTERRSLGDKLLRSSSTYLDQPTLHLTVDLSTGERRANPNYKPQELVEAYTRNFNATLKLYQDCIKTCPKPGERQAFNLSDPIRSPAPLVKPGQAVETAAQGIAGGILGGFTRGMVGGGGDRQAPPLVARPSHPEQTLTSKDGKTRIRLSGAPVGNGCQFTLGVDASPGNGAPHLIALQDGSGNTLMPSKIAVYQIWEVRGEWTLSVSWTKSYYQDGQLVKQEKGGWTTNWTELLGQYKTPGELPAIWKDFGGRPFDGVRGVVADFAFPEGQSFNPADWNFVAHIATKDGDSIVTQPFVASMKAAEKGSLSFTQHERTVWEARGR